MKNTRFLQTFLPKKTLLLSFFLVLVSSSALLAGDFKHVEDEHVDVYAADRNLAEEKAQAIEETANRFEELFGRTPPRGSVVVFQNLQKLKEHQPINPNQFKKNGAEWFLPWMESPMGKGMGSKLKPLTHEAGHMMSLHAYKDGFKKDIKQYDDNYGSPFPDWFDEGIAVYHEIEPLRNQRKSHLRKMQGDLLSLKELFSMTHPIYKKKKEQENDEKKKEGATVERHKLDNPGKMVKFYAQSYGIFQFFLEKEGKEFIRTVAEAFQKEKEFKSVLNEHAENVPTDISKLEKEWKQWLSSWLVNGSQEKNKDGNAPRKNGDQNEPRTESDNDHENQTQTKEENGEQEKSGKNEDEGDLSKRERFKKKVRKKLRRKFGGKVPERAMKQAMKQLEEKGIIPPKNQEENDGENDSSAPSTAENGDDDSRSEEAPSNNSSTNEKTKKKDAGNNGKPYLGFVPEENPNGDGLLLTEVKENSPVGKAGLKKGDVIRAMDGVRIKSLEHGRELYQEVDPGDRVTMLAVRNGWKKRITVTADALSEHRDQAQTSEEETPSKDENKTRAAGEEDTNKDKDQDQAQENENEENKDQLSRREQIKEQVREQLREKLGREEVPDRIMKQAVKKLEEKGILPEKQKRK